MNILKDSAILSLKEFNRIKNNSYFPSLTSSNNQISKSCLSPEIKKEIDISKALEHKKRLLEYDRNKKEYNDNFAKENYRRVERYPGVSSDDPAVRIMDKMCLYAKTSTTRDKQLKERKEMENVYRKKEEKIDLMVEIERLKKLKMQEDKEKQLQKMKQDGKQIILDQIEDNKKARLKQKELEEKEKLQLLKIIEEEQKKEQELNLIRIRSRKKNSRISRSKSKGNFS